MRRLVTVERKQESNVKESVVSGRVRGALGVELRVLAGGSAGAAA